MDHTQIEERAAYETWRAGWIRDIGVAIPLLIIWGLEWLITAIIHFAQQWYKLELAPTSVFLAAILLSAIAIGWSLFKRKSLTPAQTNRIQLAGTPVLLLILICWWLGKLGIISDTFLPVLHTLLLAGAFIFTGLLFGRMLTILGLWLFLAAVVFSAQFAGYAYLTMHAFGGVAMLTAALQFRLWIRR